MWCSIMSHTEKIKSEMIENLDGKKKKKKDSTHLLFSRTDYYIFWSFQKDVDGPVRKINE